MSNAAAASWTIAIILLALGLLAIALCRAAARADRAADAYRPRVWDNTAGEWVRLPHNAEPGPGQLTVSEVADADPLKLLYQAPEFAAGRARLWDAIRDEQQKGES